MLTIIKMKEEDSKLFYIKTVDGFIDANVQSGKWTPEESKVKSVEHFNKQFPDGAYSSEHHFYFIYIDNAIVGKVWLTESRTGNVWLQNIKIREEFQRKGYGKRAVLELIKIYRNKGSFKIGLHVFGYNKAALEFYKSMNFTAVSVVFEMKLNDKSGKYE